MHIMFDVQRRKHVDCPSSLSVRLLLKIYFGSVHQHRNSFNHNQCSRCVRSIYQTKLAINRGKRNHSMFHYSRTCRTCNNKKDIDLNKKQFLSLDILYRMCARFQYRATFCSASVNAKLDVSRDFSRCIVCSCKNASCVAAPRRV